MRSSEAYCAGVWLIEPFHQVEIILFLYAAVAQDIAAVAADDGVLYEVALDVALQDIAQIADREPGHQGHAGAAVAHGIMGGHANQHHGGPFGVLTGGDVIFSSLDRAVQGFRDIRRHLGAVEHVETAVIGVERQIFESDGAGVVGQPDPHGCLVRIASGRNRIDDGFHLGQAQLHGSPEMGGDLLADSGHVEDTQLTEGVFTQIIYVGGLADKYEYAEQRYQSKADAQKPRSSFPHDSILLNAFPRCCLSSFGQRVVVSFIIMYLACSFKESGRFSSSFSRAGYHSQSK